MWHAFCTLIGQIFDVIIPPRERSVRMRTRTLNDFELSPTTHTLFGISIITLLDYQSPATQDAVRALKYDGSTRAASLLSEALADHLREEIANTRAFSPRPVLLVPVPLHTSRLRERGFNQIERILEKLPSEFRDGTLSRIEPQVLTRARATKQQTKLTRAKRIANVQGAFVADMRRVSDAHLIIIDDVVTTGATLCECVRTARAAGAKVTGLAFARA